MVVLMKMRFRAAAVLALALTALCLGVCAVRSAGGPAAGAPDLGVRTESGAQDAEYFLRDCGGYIGVYSAEDPAKPEKVTDIEVSRLRGADRKLLEGGIPVSDRGELLSLLEDFGS